MKAFLLATAATLSAPLAAEISGSYQSACIALEDASIIQEATYEEGAFNWTQKVFGDTECGTNIYNLSYSGAYELTGEQQIDYTFELVELIPTLEPVAQGWTTNKLCGLENWEAGSALDVTGLECGGQQMLDSGTAFFDLIKETETGIHFGLPSEELDGSTAEKRPTEFDELELAKVEL